MRRYPDLFQFFCVLLSIFAISSEIHAAQTQHHVFYLTSGSSITTYNVEPTTGVPTRVGTPVTIAGAPWIGPIVPSPNDHFIYVFWPDGNKYSLSVYATDAYGVPKSTPAQTLSAPSWQLIIHNSGKYAYVLQTTYGQQGYSSTLYLYHIDRKTGILTQDPKIQATYGPNYYYQESFVSFNKAGTRLYDLWSVQFDGENNYFYSYHPINEATGQLSPDVGTTFTASNYTGLDETFFTTSLILNLHNQNSGGSMLNVYQNVKNPKEPLFVCTQSMLNACSAAYNYWVSVDGQYVFLPDTSANDMVVGRIETSSKKIAQTGSIPGTPFLYLSPDNQLVYSVDSATNVIQVYLFNSASGTVTTGGSTTFTSTNGYGLYPAVREWDNLDRRQTGSFSSQLETIVSIGEKSR